MLLNLRIIIDEVMIRRMAARNQMPLRRSSERTANAIAAVNQER
jgi:hypothetical protein